MSGTRLGSGRWVDAGAFPPGTTESTHQLTTADGAKVSGVLRTVAGATTVVCLAHPRQDVTHHVLVPYLLAGGYAVWTQGTRSPNNDLSLLHEQALLDLAAGQCFLRERGWVSAVSLGHSGGGPLFAFYHEQANAAPDERIARGPSGRSTGLAEAELPVPDAAVFLAPHVGQGQLLMRLIDPSVADEDDPLSADPALDPYDPANGFVPAPASSSYPPEFVARYRRAQRERVARLDALARERAAEAADARAAYAASGDPADRRRALAPRLLTVYRTDADLRGTDLSLDPNARPYGSLFGRRPDLSDYGLVGFGRLATPDAWLSTWSGLSSNAGFLRCALGVRAPALLIGLSGDQACFPADLDAMAAALGADDLTRAEVAGTHFGGPIAEGGPSGAALAAGVMLRWLAERFPAARTAG
ncbi:alpha/beta hydrolase [Actinomadura madurae]|uniref:Alpha/beta hydrolase family protein n=1 Tax=Actinomadura madurae TaxID=1993 RepID=A0A1I5GJB2_9ACTN|nr:alpha/beta hydrolase [Actinomadura madurae]SFO36013.1 hypothetical protein SAMN04489713_105233 [Actinomadura madurae]SPT51349.1 Uncharacterised protein [Actinomadura madurae]